MRQLLTHLDDLYATGHYPSFQVCVRHAGEIVLQRTYGAYRPIDAPQQWRQADDDTRYMLFSISKSVTAIAMHILFDRGLVHVDDPVCWSIPEFAQHGKDQITIRHLLTHTAGIPMLTWRISDALILDWNRVIGQLCEAKPLSARPGRVAGYHLLSSGYLLAEIIQRVDGRSLRAFLQQELLDPLGFETFNYGIDSRRFHMTACSERLDPMPPEAVIKRLNRATQLDIAQAIGIMNRPSIYEAVIPSGNVTGTAEEVSRFFEMLRCGGELDGTRILSERQVHRATAEQIHTRHDRTLFLTPQRYSLGFMLGHKKGHLNIFGPDTASAFGHLGFTRNLGWADPKRGLAVGFLTNSKITVPRGETVILRRFQSALNERFG